MASVFKRVGRPVDEFSLFPVSDIYLSDIHFQGNHGSKALLWILFTIAFFIVTIAGVTFVNLSTARASTRAREIGIKKVVGALRTSLRQQFLGESMFVALAALGVALGFAVLFFPVFNRTFALGLRHKILFDPGMLICAMVGACIIGIISGLYPALYLSAFQPATVIRGDVTKGRKGSFFRKVLIVFQFSVSVILLIGTLTITSQVRFARNKDLGFSAKNVIIFPQPRLESFNRNLENIKAELLGHPDILEVSFSQGYPGWPRNNESFKVGEDYIGFTHYSVDSDFADVYGLQLLEGRSHGGILYSGDNLAGIVTHAKETWKRFAPGFPFEFSFLDQEIQGMYAKDAVFEQVFLYAAGFSILIACLGLLGLASYVTAKRTKEIGIRKVLGASLSQILALLSKEFTLAIALANLIAWPAAYYLMKKWLANFAYRIDLGIGIFALSALLALGMALITVGWQSLKAASADPVNSLRYE